VTRSRLIAALAAVVVLLLLAGLGAVGYWRGWFFDPTIDDAASVEIRPVISGGQL